MISFGAFSGNITRISDLRQGQNEDGSIVNFVAAPNTYFVDHTAVFVGDKVTGYFDANAPVPLIYPPQYQAIIMVKSTQGKNVKVDYFDSQLISSDGNLKLNIAPSTQILLPNDQPFNRNPANRNLIAIYGPATKSIPAQTTPYKIIVMC